VSGRWAVYWDDEELAYLAEPNGPCLNGCPCNSFATWAEAIAYVYRVERGLQ